MQLIESRSGGRQVEARIENLTLIESNNLESGNKIFHLGETFFRCAFSLGQRQSTSLESVEVTAKTPENQFALCTFQTNRQTPQHHSRSIFTQLIRTRADRRGTSQFFPLSVFDFLNSSNNYLHRAKMRILNHSRLE